MSPESLGGGTVERVSAARVDYALDFTFPSETGNAAMHLEGFVANPATPVELPDAFSLSGWSVHALGPHEESTSTGAILDYGARPSSRKLQTLGDLRRAAARK